MSYPSINSADKDSFLAAFKTDLPLGFAFLEAIAEKRKTLGEAVSFNEAPGSDLGKQIIRLLGANVPRALLEEVLGVRFLFLNCCGGRVYLPDEPFPDLNEQMQLQYDNQNGVNASADC